MADQRRDQDWRWRQSGGRDPANRSGGGEYDRTNWGSQGSGYPDDLDAGYGSSRSPNYADRSDMWNDNGRMEFGDRYNSGNTRGYGGGRDYRDEQSRSRDFGDRYGSDRYYGEGGYTTDPDRPSSTYRNRVGRGGYGGGDRNWMDKAGDEVTSWFGDDNAAERRDEDKRRDGHYGRGPKGYRRSDARITEDLNDRLYEDWRLDASEINVEVKDGEVTLSGSVQSREDKRRAEDLADDISGVDHVQNNLRVVRTTGDSGTVRNSVPSGTPGNSGGNTNNNL